MGDLFVMMGVPGSGKTTLAKKLVEDKPNTVRVSRDDIRFSLLEKDDEYLQKKIKSLKLLLKLLINIWRKVKMSLLMRLILIGAVEKN